MMPFFFDASNVRSYELSPAVVPLMKEKTKTVQDETNGVAVTMNNVASEKTEIGNTEQTAKMLKEEIQSLDGEQRAAIIFEVNSKQGEAKGILELACTTHMQLEATIADSYAQLRRITGLTALD
jgi:flavodoxin